MNISDGEKLILVMLCDLFKKLKIEGEVDPNFVEQAIFSGNLWGLKWQYTGIFGSEETTDAVVSETADILDMWDFIEHAHKKLSPTDKDRVEREVKYFGKDPKFPGFDGNHEGTHMGTARFLTEQLKRFKGIGERSTINSHTRMLPAYRRMLAVFETIRPTLTDGPMNADQIIQVLKARAHAAAS